jgi:hypothetical protein
MDGMRKESDLYFGISFEIQSKYLERGFSIFGDAGLVHANLRILIQQFCDAGFPVRTIIPLNDSLSSFLSARPWTIASGSVHGILLEI